MSDTELSPSDRSTFDRLFWISTGLVLACPLAWLVDIGMHRNAAREARRELVELKSECTREIDALKSRIIGLEEQIASSEARDRIPAIVANHSHSRPAGPLPLPVTSHGDLIEAIIDDSEPETVLRAFDKPEVEPEDNGTITWKRSKDVDQFLQSALEVMDPKEREIVDRFVARGDQFRRGMSPGEANALENKTDFLMSHALTELERMLDEGSPEDRASAQSLLKDSEMMAYIGEMFEIMATCLVDPFEAPIQDLSSHVPEPVASDGRQR